MKFQEGNPGKPKGAQNKVTAKARELFIATIEGQMEHIAEAFEKVRHDKPAEYLKILEKYAQYVVPKKVDVTTDNAPIINAFGQITTDQLHDALRQLEQGGTGDSDTARTGEA